MQTQAVRLRHRFEFLPMNIRSRCTIVLCSLMLVSEVRADSADLAQNTAKYPLELLSVGARYGTNAATDKNGAFDQYAIFASWRTPWAWEFTKGWDIGWRLNASIGALHGQDDTGAVGTLVPTIALGDTENVFAFEAGAGVGLFSKWEFPPTDDFGGPLQFILDVGINFRVARHVGIGYRFQHWSDASIHDNENRGVEMHMLELSYRF